MKDITLNESIYVTGGCGICGGDSEASKALFHDMMQTSFILGLLGAATLICLA